MKLTAITFRSAETRRGAVRYFVNGKRISAERAGFLRARAEHHDCIVFGTTRSGKKTFECLLRVPDIYVQKATP